MLSKIAKDKDFLRAAEIIERAEKNGRRLGFMNQTMMNPFDIITIFLFIPIIAVTVGWVILKGVNNNGKN